MKIWRKGRNTVKNRQTRFCSGDFLAAAAVVLLAAAVFACFLPAGKTSAACAEVYQNGKLLRTVSLDTPTEFTVEGKYRNTVTVLDGKIAVTASDCPGEDCVHSGWTDSLAKSIVCLPNELEIRIGAQSGDVDFVVR